MPWLKTVFDVNSYELIYDSDDWAVSIFFLAFFYNVSCNINFFETLKTAESLNSIKLFLLDWFRFALIYSYNSFD